MPFWIELAVPALSFILAVIIGRFLIPALSKIGAKQSISVYAPETHKKKAGTPMMGGLMFIISSAAALFIGLLLYNRFSSEAVLRIDTSALWKLITGFAFMIANAVIGFADDFTKAVRKKNDGLSVGQKLIVQFGITALYLFALFIQGDTSTLVYIPFFGNIDLWWFYYPIMMLIIVFLVNAVNLTDGIDGLCGSVTAIAAVSLAMISSAMNFDEYTLLCLAVAGGCVGFLVYNLHPASVFMGDVGSMYLGGFIVAVGFALRIHVLLVIVMLVYVIECGSVFLQRTYFKATHGKRLPIVTPLHHHFERKMNWSENKIVITFTAVALICGAAANIIFWVDRH
jgi:phospho-N-acetylmuramoyl-pentapeptide-transferase